jgi:hypothetical protein
LFRDRYTIGPPLFGLERGLHGGREISALCVVETHLSRHVAGKWRFSGVLDNGISDA